jgi:hypothetical protein
MKYMKKGELLIFSIGIFLLLVPFISAEVIIGQTEALYNLGDSLNINITLSSPVGVNSFLILKIVCDSGEVEIYKSTHKLGLQERKNVYVSTMLDSLLITNLQRDCFVSGSYAGDGFKSQKFEISKRVDLQFASDKAVNPDSELKISGVAKKANGGSLNGFVEVSVPSIGISNSGFVNDGEFNLSLDIPRKVHSGSYEINVRAYDKDDQKAIANEGSLNGLFKINQIIELMDIAFDKTEIAPGENLVYTVLLYDQAEDQAKEEVEASVIKPDGSISEKVLTFSGSHNTLLTKKNSAPGYWAIEAKSGTFEYKKTFYIKEFENVSFSIINETLSITNTGNVPFNKPLKLSIGEFSEIKDMNLEVGATKKFKLSAPNGVYSIGASGSNESYNLGNTFLTGRSLFIKDSEDDSGSNLSFWMWSLVILALCFGVVYFSRKTIKRSYFGRTPKSLSLPNIFKKKDSFENLNQKTASTALNSKFFGNRGGKKESCVVVSLKIKNNKPEEDISSVINSVFEKARMAKGKILDNEEYKVIIFSQTLTKEEDNKMRALKFARTIAFLLEGHNKSSAAKIKFGIGVHIGEMIIESIGSIFKFNALGNTIVLAKKASEKSDGGIFLSKAFQMSARNLIKAEPLPAENFWRLKSIVDRSEHEEFIQRFMKKQ